MEFGEALKQRFPEGAVDRFLATYSSIEVQFALLRWRVDDVDYAPLAPALLDLARAAEELGSATDESETRQSIVQAVAFARRLAKRVPVDTADVTLAFYTLRWVLASLVRLSLGDSDTRITRLLEPLFSRALPVAWKHDGRVQVLTKRMPARQQILVVLYDKSPQTELELRDAVIYGQLYNFRQLLKRLQEDRYLAYRDDGSLAITPKGVESAENVIATLMRRGTFLLT